LITATASSDPGRAIGLALVTGSDVPAGRAYLCDPRNHTVDVVDLDNRPIFSFGGRGRRLGQLDTPTDVAVVWLTQEDRSHGTLNEALLVVADRGNHRVQLFELDGVPVAAIDGVRGRRAPGSWPLYAGSPYFRLARATPRFLLPSRLAWHAPYLDVTCEGGSIVRLDLGGTRLPGFETWLRNAPRKELKEALEFFTSNPARAIVPDTCLLAIVQRIQPFTPTRLSHDGRVGAFEKPA
jgi:hypothetical protein